MYRFCVLFLCILIYQEDGFVQGENFEKVFRDKSGKPLVIYDITSVTNEALENDTLAKSSFQNIFRNKEPAVYYQTGQEIQDLNELSMKVKSIYKLMKKHGSGNPKLFINLNYFNDLSITNGSEKLTSPSMLPGVAALIIHACSDVKRLKTVFNPSSFLLGIDGLWCDGLAVNDSIIASDFVYVSMNKRIPYSYTIFKELLSISKASSEENFKKFMLPHIAYDTYSRQCPAKVDLAYDFHLDEYVNNWINDNGTSLIITFLNYSHLENLSGGSGINKEINSGRSNLVIPTLHEIESLTDLNYSLPEAINMVSTAFGTLHVSHGMWEYLSSNWNVAGTQTKLEQNLDVIVEMNAVVNGIDQLSEYANDTISLRSSQEERNMHMKSLDFFMHGNGSVARIKDVTLTQEFDNIIRNTRIGCLFIVSNFSSVPDPYIISNLTRDRCGFSFQKGSEFTWYFRLDLKNDPSLKADKDFVLLDYFTLVSESLEKILIARNVFHAIKPNAIVILKIRIITPDWMLEIGDKAVRNFYCNKGLLFMNSLVEMIVNWGRIHEFPILIKDAFEINGNGTGRVGWWSQTEPSFELSAQVRRVPHFVMRNYPNKIINWKLDPCVEWSKKAPKPRIALDKDLSGVSVSMNIRNDSLNASELQNILMFALKTFKTVELIPKSGKAQLTDLQTLNSLLETDFLEALVDFEVLDGRLYLHVSMDGSSVKQILEEVTKIASKISQGPASGVQLSGVHLSHWETVPQILVNKVVKLGQEHNFKVGFFIQNCSILLNNLVTSPKNYTLLPLSDYIICPTKKFPAHNENRKDMATSLDTHLYMTSVFSRLRKDLSVFWRLNSFPSSEVKKEETSNLMRFLNDVNQFAVGNKLKYFLVQAFTSTGGSYSSSSWFRVVRYTDLSDPTVFFEKERELNNLTIWRPPPASSRPRRNKDGHGWVFYTLIGVGVVVGVIMILVLLFFVYRKVMNKGDYRPN